MSDDRTTWLTSREAFENSARMLHKQFPDSVTYAAQVQVLDENRALQTQLAEARKELELLRKRGNEMRDCLLLWQDFLRLAKEGKPQPAGFLDRTIACALREWEARVK